MEINDKTFEELHTYGSKILSQTPTQKIPWRCRHGFHKWTCWERPLCITSDMMCICQRCGLVKKGWMAFGGIGGVYSHFERIGYITLPNSFASSPSPLKSEVI